MPKSQNQAPRPQSLRQRKIPEKCQEFFSQLKTKIKSGYSDSFYGRKSKANKILPLLTSVLPVSPLKREMRQLLSYRSPTGIKIIERGPNHSPSSVETPGGSKLSRAAKLNLEDEGSNSISIALFQDKAACGDKRGEFKPVKSDEEVFKALENNPRNKLHNQRVLAELTIGKQSYEHPAAKESQQKYFNYVNADEIIRAYLISAIKHENPGINNDKNEIQKLKIQELMSQAYEYSHTIARSAGGKGAAEMQAWVSSKAFNSAHSILAEKPGYEIITKENQQLHYQSNVLLLKNKNGDVLPIISSEVIEWSSGLTKMNLTVELDFDIPTPAKQLEPFLKLFYDISFSLKKEKVSLRHGLFSHNNKLGNSEVKPQSNLLKMR